MSSATYSAPGVYVEEVPSAQQPIAGVGTNVVGFIGIVPSKVYVPVPNPDYDPVLARAKLQRDAIEAKLQAGTQLGDAEKAALAEQAKQAEVDFQAKLQRHSTAQAAMRAKAQDARTEVTKRETAASDAEQQLGKAKDALKNATAETKEKLEDDLAAAERANTLAQQALFDARAAARDLQAAADDNQRAFDDASKKETPPPDAAKPAAAATAAAGGEGAGSAKEGGKKPVETEDEAFRDPDPDEVEKLVGPSFLQPFILQPVAVEVPVCETKFCTNFTEYTRRFGSFSAYRSEPDQPAPANPDRWVFSPLHPGHHALTHALNGFFRNGGTKAFVARIERLDQLEKALDQFESIDDLAIIAAPGLPKLPGVWSDLMDRVEKRRTCFAILDSREVVNNGEDEDLAIDQLDYSSASTKPALPRVSKNAAFYFPHIQVVDPAKQLQDLDPRRKVAPKYRGLTYVPPSGHVAGIYARTDTERGVHKAPANCVVRGALEVKYYVSKPIQEQLNPQGVNAIRIMNGAVTVWGARTIGGDANSEWKYVSVRRLFLFLQKSIEEGTQWIVFEPNDEALWGKIRLNITAFLTNVWRTGALFGTAPEQAFYVKCDAELNPPEVRDVGQVVCEIGVAIVRPAEFVIFRITQSTGMNKA